MICSHVMQYALISFLNTWPISQIMKSGMFIFTKRGILVMSYTNIKPCVFCIIAVSITSGSHRHITPQNADLVTALGLILQHRWHRGEFHLSGNCKNSCYTNQYITTHHRLPLVDHHAQSDIPEGGEINHTYYTRCTCLDYLIVRYNNKSPEKVVHDEIFIT